VVSGLDQVELEGRRRGGMEWAKTVFLIFQNSTNLLSLVMDSWLDLSKLVTSDAAEHKSAFPELAHDIGVL